jgi:ketosteroid isomerase-like protein
MQAVRWSVASVSCALLLSSPVSAAPSKTDVAATIKADVAEIVAGINAHDAVRTTRFDAADVIGLESLNTPIIGAKADKDGFAEAFKRAPNWRLKMVDETVDVADAGDKAVYRSTYDEDSVAADGTPMTHKVNFLAGFRHDPDGNWRVHWYVVNDQERSHKK